MKAQASMLVAGEMPRRFAFPTCPRCDDVLIAAAASAHISENHVRHVWSCDSCGHEFVTSVSLPLARRRDLAA